jgi:hypothetical protein
MKRDKKEFDEGPPVPSSKESPLLAYLAANLKEGETAEITDKGDAWLVLTLGTGIKRRVEK